MSDGLQLRTYMLLLTNKMLLVNSVYEINVQLSLFIIIERHTVFSPTRD